MRPPMIEGVRAAMRVLAEQAEVLPAVGGAQQEEERPDADEQVELILGREEKLFEANWETDPTALYRPLQPLTRDQQHLFRYFQDGSYRNYFLGNKYAPARESTSPIIEQVLDIAERGRSLGVILFGAEQFRSAVHPRVAGNCATHIFGRTGSTELADVAYRVLDADVRMSLTRLEKGELLLSHATFRQPVKIRFPRPAYRQEGAP